MILRKTIITDIYYSCNHNILFNVSTAIPRPWIPSSLRMKVFRAAHDLSHPSTRATVKLIKKRYIWDSIKHDVANWAKSCVSCQKAKVIKHTESGIASFPQPNRRFGHIHVDVVGPLPQSEGKRYIFTIIDRSTRWPEAVPMSDASTDACVSALLNNWIARFGLPDIITSDRGSVFTSAIWNSLANRLGVTTTTTTAYNPEANGIIERFHRSLKAALMSRCISSSWATELPWVLLGLRTTPKRPDNMAPAEKVYGDQLTVPYDFFRCTDEPSIQQLRDNVKKYIPCKQTYATTRSTYVPADLPISTHVFMRIDKVKPPLTPPYTGPFKVLERKQKAYLIEIGNTKDWVSIDRLKPAYLMENDQPTITFSKAGRPLRGRPPRGGSTVGVTETAATWPGRARHWRDQSTHT